MISTYPTREYKGFTIELEPDQDPISPEEWNDDGLVLLHYHRNFTMYPDSGDFPRTGQQYVEWLGREHYELDEDEREWFVFPLESYIHSGVVLAFENRGNFPDRRWDVSRCGSIVMKRSWYKELGTKQTPEQVAEGHLKVWNQHLEGDVWGYKVFGYEWAEADVSTFSAPELAQRLEAGTVKYVDGKLLQRGERIDLTEEGDISVSWGSYGEDAAFECAQESIDIYMNKECDR